MSTVAEIEAVIPKLSRQELEEFRRWFEDYVEGHLELHDKVVVALEQSKREIAAGGFSTRFTIGAGADGLPLIRADRGVITSQQVKELETLAP
ncbi:MAG: hypothetical protein HY301_09700 [Verrucomicrobia bacterium]|nr:hypothetical protein [Verrucomicrobiota bacterium]